MKRPGDSRIRFPGACVRIVKRMVPSIHSWATHRVLQLSGPRTKHIYVQSTTVYVPSSELGLSHPLSRQRVCPYPRAPPRYRGGGGILACGLGVGEVPILTTGEKALHSAYSVGPRLFFVVYKVPVRTVLTVFWIRAFFACGFLH